MAEEKKQEVTVTVSYMVKHMSDGSIVTEGMKGDLTEEQILNDIESIGKLVTERKADLKNLNLVQQTVYTTVKNLIPEIVDSVTAKMKEEPAENKTTVKKLGK